MSLTEVYSKTADGRTTSTGSIALRPRSPLPEEGSHCRKSFERGGEIELAQLGVAEEATDIGEGLSTTGKTSPLPPSDPPKFSKWTAHVQYLTLLWSLFLAGWNDGTTGPLLPRIQSNYHVRVRGAHRMINSG
jgi:hypothetical protein